MTLHSVPDLHAFAAVSANVYIFSAFEYLCSEMNILFIVPYFFEWLSLQITHTMRGIFVETAGHYKPVPGNYCRMPQAPAMVVETILGGVFSTLGFFVSAENVRPWQTRTV